MSVINRMLRDLDARAASEKERAGLPSRLRSLPAVPSRAAATWQLLLAGTAIGGLLAGSVWWLTLPADQPTVPPAPTIPAPVVATAVPAGAFAATPATPAAPAQPLALNDPLALPLVAALPPLPTPATTRAVTPGTDAEHMKLSLQISRQPASIAHPPAAPMAGRLPAVDRLAAGDTTPASTVAAAPVAAPIAADPAADSVTAVPAARVAAPQIDKRSKTDTASEQAEADYRLAMQAVQHSDTATALAYFQRALQAAPTLVKVRQGYLAVLVAARHWDAAQQVAAAGLAIDPAQSGWATVLARLQYEHNAPADAAATLAHYAAHATQDADFQALYAVVLHKLQRPAEAVERYRAALQLRSGEWRWWFGLGLALEAVGDAPAARTAFTQARVAGQVPEAMLPIIAEKLK